MPFSGLGRNIAVTRGFTQPENDLQNVVKRDDAALAPGAVEDNRKALAGTLHLAQGAFEAHLRIKKEGRFQKIARGLVGGGIGLKNESLKHNDPDDFALLIFEAPNRHSAEGALAKDPAQFAYRSCFLHHD